MKLIEAVKNKADTYDNIGNLNDLKKLMKGFKDNKVRTVSIDFGRAYINTYDTPSKIRYTAVSDSPMVAKGFWKKGKMYPFPEKLIIKNQKHDGSGGDR